MSDISPSNQTASNTNFAPAWWLPGPHLPTLWAALARPNIALTPRSERLDLPDGDFVDLAWVGNDQGPLVLVLHGLEGSLDSTYAQRILQRVEQRGWGAVLMHFRGCSGTPNRKDRSYHSGDTGDLDYVLQVLVQRYPKRALMAIGYSLGGNVLLKYLGQSGKSARLVAAGAVSVPFDLAAGAKRLNQGFSKLYQWRLVRSMQAKLRRKFAHRVAPIPLQSLDEWNDFWAFDHNVTAPLHGFNSAREYYERSSCRQYLRTIAIPTIVIHSRDDPFLVVGAIPQPHELSATTELALTDRGGHVGFVAGRVPLKAQYWIDDRLMAWFGKVSQSTTQANFSNPNPARSDT